MPERPYSVKDNIIKTAWDLFFKQGYEATTLNDIIAAAGISKGTFYYYFKSKDTLLNTLSLLLDEKYEELDKEIPADMDAFDKLMLMNYEAHKFLGENIDYSLLASLYASQLIREDRGSLLDVNRYYYSMVMRVIDEGQQKGEITTDFTVSEIIRIYSLCERALITDWCMRNGSYSLGDFSKEYMPVLFGAFRGSKGD